MRNSKEERIVLYNMLYVKLSKVTAEIKNEKREDVRLVFVGKVKDLFQEIKTDPGTIAKFLWAVSHKTDVLPTVLFRIVNHGVKGLEISRIHSGFYDAQRNHITGSDLVPFIIKAAELYKPTPRAKKEPVVILPKASKLPIKVISEQEMIVNHECELATALTGLSGVSDDALAYFGKDAKERYEKAKADLDAYTEEIQRREQEREKVAKKQELLKTISELIAGEGFTLDEIMQIV